MKTCECKNCLPSEEHLLNKSQREHHLQHIISIRPKPQYTLSGSFQSLIEPLSSAFKTHLVSQDHGSLFRTLLSSPFPFLLTSRTICTNEPFIHTQTFTPFLSFMLSRTYDSHQTVSNLFKFLSTDISASPSHLTVLVNFNFSLDLEISFTPDQQLHDATLAARLETRLVINSVDPFIFSRTTDTFSFDCRTLPSSMVDISPKFLLSEFFFLHTQFLDTLLALSFLNSSFIPSPNSGFQFLTPPSTSTIVSVEKDSVEVPAARVPLAIEYTGCTVNRKLIAKSMDLSHNLMQMKIRSRLDAKLQDSINLDSKLIKSPAKTFTPAAKGRLTQSSYPPSKSDYSHSPREDELPLLPANLDCALLRNVNQTRSHIKPYMTFTPPLTTASEMKSRPPTSLQDYRKSMMDYHNYAKTCQDLSRTELDRNDVTPPNVDSPRPIESAFVFAVFEPKKKKDLVSRNPKVTDETAGAPILSQNSAAPITLPLSNRQSQPWKNTCSKSMNSTYKALLPESYPTIPKVLTTGPVTFPISTQTVLLLSSHEEPQIPFFQETDQAEPSTPIVCTTNTTKDIALDDLTDQSTMDSIDDEDIILNLDSPDCREGTFAFTAYKRVDKKVKPIPTTFPEDCLVRRCIPEDPLLTLPPLPYHPPNFVPTYRISEERMDILDVNGKGFLWPEEERLFKHIMVLNEESIAFEDAERGTFKESYFSPYIIPTVPHRPWEYKNIPIAPGIREKVMDVLRLKIEAGVYERSSSSYRSQWFVVLKKNGKLRIVHDLQPLNKVTIRDAGNLPVVDDFVEGFASRQCYTVFDLFWGFDARKIHPKSRDLTAFSTPMGLLQITSLPTGFTNSPAEFQKCMSIILQDEIPTTANIFIDDLPIKGPTTQYLDSEGNPEVLEENSGIRRFIWEHAQDVHRIMHKVKCAGATFAANKAQICRPEVLIIGQTCNAAGRSPDESRVDKILKWPPLSTPKEVRQFLGLCGTVRIWIPNYSKLVQPLTELYRNGYEFIWDDRRQSAFEEIKSLISSAPALHPIDYTSDNPVVLSVDSSKEAAGFILSQLADNGKTKRPARYGSIPMSLTESRYSQPKLELFGLYRALHEWRRYIIGVKKLIVEVDAKYIKGMLKSPDLQPNATTIRWIQGIKLFDFELVHVPADKHRGPDALSRRPLTNTEPIEDHDDSWLDDIALLTFIPYGDFPPFPKLEEPSKSGFVSGLQCYLARQRQNDMIQSIIDFHKTADIPKFNTIQAQKRFLSKCGEFFLKDQRLFKKNGNKPPLQVITNPEHKQSILLHAHEKLGHRGIFAVTAVIGARFFWPKMRADIHHHVKSCHECQIRSLRRLEIPLTVSAPVTLFAKIYIDIMHMPLAYGFKYIVAAKDDLSGTSEAAPLRNATAQNLAKFFWEYIYCRYGAPLHVVTDNGPEVKEAFDKLLKRLGIPQVRITPYNHHANGVVERGHFIIREALLKTCKANLLEWPERLPEIIFADRVTTNRVTGFSPYQLLHATDPLLPLDIAEATFLVEEFRSGITTERLLELRARQIAKHPADLARAAETLRKARFTSKRNFETRFLKRLSTQVHKPGDLVLARNTGKELSHNRKHHPRYLGPYEVAERTFKGNYKLKELDGTPLKYICAAFRVIPYITRNHPFMHSNREEEEEEESTEEDEDDTNSDSGDESE